MIVHDPIRGYGASEDLVALANFIKASNVSDADLAFDVYCKMIALNQAIRNADVAGIEIRLIRTEHIHMKSSLLMLMATRDGKDVAFLDIDFRDEPIAPSPNPERVERERRDLCIAEGRAAYRSGLPITRCPPFKDNDWRIDWQNGWRWERDGE